VDHSIYEVPLDLAKQDVDVYILEKLNLHVNRINLDDWREMIENLIHPKAGEVEIAVVGKYISLKDSYKSIYESLTHGGAANNARVKVRMVESEEIEKRGAEAVLGGVSGILVPGGFGNRGVEGKIAAGQYAREQKIPYFGICLGMQCSVMEFARNVCGLEKANSTEFDAQTPNPVIDLMESQKGVQAKGGTMRLGAYPCRLAEGSLAHAAYGTDMISERHRHRYEFNNRYRATLEAAGMVISGQSPDGGLVEIVELRDHPWYVACQFHPEFKSTALRAHPLFKGFVGAALARAPKSRGNGKGVGAARVRAVES
jgi:CTP synthase